MRYLHIGGCILFFSCIIMQIFSFTPITGHLQIEQILDKIVTSEPYTYMCAILRAGHIVAVVSWRDRREAWSLLGGVQVAPADLTPPVVETFSSTLLHPRPVLASGVILTCQLTFHAGILPISCRVDQVVATKIYSIVIQTAGPSQAVLCHYDEDKHCREYQKASHFP